MTEMFAVDRRGLLERIALLIGASALPAEVLAAPDPRAKRFLAPPQLALLAAVADTMIPATDTPGAVAAEVPARIDAMLAGWASAETRAAMTDALARIDAAAIAQNQKAFVALPGADREALLRAHDAAALKPAPSPAGMQPANPMLPKVLVADPGYLRLKELAISLYYFSEAAATTELIYEHFPGKWQPSIKLTPGSRPYLGNAAI